MPRPPKPAEAIGAGYHHPVTRRPTTDGSTIELDGLRVTVERKRVKNLNLRVHPPHGDVYLSAPLGTPDTAIRRLIRERRSWIDKHRLKFSALPAPTYREYLSGERISLLGEEQVLRFANVSGSPKRPLRKPTSGTVPPTTELLIEVPIGATREVRKRALERHLRREATHLFAAEVAAWEPRLGVSVVRLGIRRMKTRWGTCNPTARRVWLNLALIERPRKCLEYVVVHELAHLLVADHSRAFWALVEQHLPDFRTAKALLARSPLWLDD